ncbi:acyltransferase family protein [Streptomyces sp. NRRL F-5126]|uniref:acyltransferase family protein n=1 Tax=Streptomyces sp. NRRL F-5126 TaxID=1463857 RepID=UPI00055DECBF|nr:acyltransferase [Streptomyces sp. NRRL F-5126]
MSTPYAGTPRLPGPARHRAGSGGPVATQPALQPPAETAPGTASAGGGRDRYLDTLRAIALVRVVVFHIFSWTWLTIVFPSMGVMFALAGSLMARSLSQRGATRVIKGRVRRLLPPMWVFGLFVVGTLLYAGWHPSRHGGGITGIVSVLNWIVPVGAPPYPDPAAHPWGWLDSSWADQAAGPLWYIRAYLWFVLASPLLLRLFRRAPWAALALPLVLCAVCSTGIVTIPGETGEAVTDFATYGACWVLGFAHHDGLFRGIPRYLTVSCASFMMAAGLWWASGHLTSEGWNLDEIPLGQALWSLGFVTILLQVSPSWKRLPDRLARFDPLITLANNRAVTIYLWHNLLIMVTFPIIDQAWNIPGIDRFGSELDASYSVLSLVLVWPLLAAAIVLLGWFEDLAAKRRPRLWPDGRTRRMGRGTARTG